MPNAVNKTVNSTVRKEIMINRTYHGGRGREGRSARLLISSAMGNNSKSLNRRTQTRLYSQTAVLLFLRVAPSITITPC